MGGLGNFKIKIINLFLTLSGVKPHFLLRKSYIFQRNYQINVFFTYIFSDFCLIFHVIVGFYITNMIKCYYFLKFWQRKGGCSRQIQFVKNSFVKNRVGGWVVNLNLGYVCKYTLFFLQSNHMFSCVYFFCLQVWWFLWWKYSIPFKSTRHSSSSFQSFY